MHGLFRSPRRTFVVIAVAYFAIHMFALFTASYLYSVTGLNDTDIPSVPPEGIELALVWPAVVLGVVAKAMSVPIRLLPLGPHDFLGYLASLAVNALFWAAVVTGILQATRALRLRLSHR